MELGVCMFATENGKSGDRVEGGVLADEGDIRPMEGRDNTRRPFAFEHLPGDPGRGRMGNRVVHVHEIQPEFFGHLMNRNREGERIGGMLEEGILIHLHFVEIKTFAKTQQAERLSVGDEVDLVTAVGERESQLGSDRAGAAVRRVTGNPNFHGDPVCSGKIGFMASPFRRAHSLPLRGRVRSPSTSPLSW
jgi:hypothetical protein